jgi:hypothetical protein
VGGSRGRCCEGWVGCRVIGKQMAAGWRVVKWANGELGAVGWDAGTSWGRRRRLGVCWASSRMGGGLGDSPWVGQGGEWTAFGSRRRRG